MMRSSVFVLLWGCLWAIQLLAAPAKDMTSTILEASNGIEIFDQEQYLTAEGDVKIQRDDITIHGKKGWASYEKIGKERQLNKIKVMGNLRIISPDGKVFADLGVYDIPADKITLTGKNLKAINVRGTTTAKDHFIYKPEAQQLHAQGDVFVHSEKEKMQASRIISHFKPAKKGTPSKEKLPGNENLELDRMEAFGDVVIKSEKGVSKSDKATYIQAEDTYILEGHVRVTDETRHMVGEYARINRKTGQSKVWAYPPSKKKPSKPTRIKLLILSSKKNEK